MDPKEEQEVELEVLEAIYGDDFNLIDPPTVTSGARFEIQTDDGEADIKLRLSFTHTLQYPEEALIIVVYALEGLSTPNRKKLQDYLEGVAGANLQMPCVHTVCDAAREWLVDNVVGKAGDEDLDEEEERKFETLDSTVGEKVEVVSSKAIGTPVTVETFAAWRADFEEKMKGTKSKEQLERESNTKMTGRQLFESKTIVVSAESESFWEAEASDAFGE